MVVVGLFNVNVRRCGTYLRFCLLIIRTGVVWFVIFDLWGSSDGSARFIFGPIDAKIRFMNGLLGTTKPRLTVVRSISGMDVFGASPTTLSAIDCGLCRWIVHCLR